MQSQSSQINKQHFQVVRPYTYCQVLLFTVTGVSTIMKNSSFTYFILFLLMTSMFLGCQQIQQVITPEKNTTDTACADGNRVLNVGFYAYFAPVSYSADEDPTADAFNTHQGYEADLLTALEMMENTGVSFTLMKGSTT